MKEKHQIPVVRSWAKPANEALRRVDRADFTRNVGGSADDLVTTGRVHWRRSEMNFELIAASDPQRSLWRFEQALPDLVWNAAALEGNTFTLPEVRTLLEGVTVGGKRQEDADQIFALSAGMDLMVTAVKDGSFRMDKETSDRIHAIVAEKEAIESGQFRGEGVVGGGGTVNLANGGSIAGDPHGHRGELLIQAHTNLLADLARLGDPREQALAYFASATRSQFYFDGNKRTARIMMTGFLIQSGFEPVNVPFARKNEFNTALDELFTHDEATQLMDFLTTCSMSHRN